MTAAEGGQAENELRLDPLTREWVTIVAARQDRPNLAPEGTDPESPCPFCVGGREAPEPYSVRAFTNRGPVFTPGAPIDVVGALAGAAGFVSLPARGAAEVSLNFCALADFLSPELAVTVSRRVLRRALLSADNVFQLERLHSFSRKFHPDWRPRYLCVEKLGDLPLVGLAYLRVEQLLTPPSRWRKRDPVSHS